MIRAFRLLAGLAVALAAPAFAADEPEQHCDGSTYEIVDCLKAQTAQWDKRMNAAYQLALKDAEGKQREQLRVAQRLWVEYRDANCLYYDLGEGTIARIEAGYCMLDTTKTRALELEEKDREALARWRNLLSQPPCRFSGRSIAARRPQIGLAHQRDRDSADQRLQRGDEPLVMGAARRKQQDGVIGRDARAWGRRAP